jgi:hypothetical protein
MSLMVFIIVNALDVLCSTVVFALIVYHTH